MLDGLQTGLALTQPGDIADLGYRWHHEHWKGDPLSWSRQAENDGTVGKSAGDTRTARDPEPHYQTVDDRLLAEQVPPEEQCRVCLGLPD